MIRSFALASLFSLFCSGAFADVAAVRDVNTTPWQGEVASITVGATVYKTGRALKVVCTAGGVLTLTYADGSTGSWSVQGGTPAITTIIQGAFSQVTASTATCSSYANLK